MVSATAKMTLSVSVAAMIRVQSSPAAIFPAINFDCRWEKGYISIRQYGEWGNTADGDQHDMISLRENLLVQNAGPHLDKSVYCDDAYALRLLGDRVLPCLKPPHCSALLARLPCTADPPSQTCEGKRYSVPSLTLMRSA